MVTTLRLPLPHGLHGFFRPRSPPPWPAWSPGSRRRARRPCALTISLPTEEVERRLGPTALHLPVPPGQFGRGSDNGRAISIESPARSALGGQAVASLWLPVKQSAVAAVQEAVRRAAAWNNLCVNETKGDERRRTTNDLLRWTATTLLTSNALRSTRSGSPFSSGPCFCFTV